MFKQKSEVMFAKSTNITTPSIKTHVRKGIESILLVVIDLSLVLLLLIYKKHETVQYIANVYCIEGVDGAGQSEREESGVNRPIDPESP